MRWVFVSKLHTKNTVWLQNQNEKATHKVKIDSNSKLLSFVFVRVFHPSILICMQNSLFCLQCIPSILIGPESSTEFSTIAKYQNMQIFITKLFTIYTGPSQGLTLLVVKNTDKYVWCQNCSTLLNIQCNNVHCTTVPMWNPCWSINGYNYTESCMCNTLSRHKLCIVGRALLGWTHMPIG